MNTRRKSGAVILMRLQIIISVLFVIFGALFPFYIGHRYGMSAMPVYDRFGAVIGESNYLLMSIGFGLFAIAIGSLGVTMALRTLKRLQIRSEEQ